MGCWTLHKALDADEGVTTYSPCSLCPRWLILLNSVSMHKKTAHGLATRGRWDFSGNLTWFLRGRPGRLRGVPRGRGTVSSSHS
jgi:hypothetical protein